MNIYNQKHLQNEEKSVLILETSTILVVAGITAG